MRAAARERLDDLAAFWPFDLDAREADCAFRLIMATTAKTALPITGLRA